MCFISLDRKNVRLFIDVLFVCSPLLDQEITAADHWSLSLSGGGRELRCSL